VPVGKGGRLDTGLRTLTGSAIFDRLRRRAGEAGVARFSPHDLRRTFIGDHLDAGTDVVTIQRLAGHRDVSTTARYDRRPEAAKQRAAEAISVPYAAGS
jgi:integrase